MTDFDHFKQVNDRHGHLFGDRALRTAVERIRTTLRTGDVVGRYGGEELLVVLPHTGRAAALEVANRLRHAVADHVDQLDGVRVSLTVSIGVATLDDVELPSVEALVDAAHVALYRAKAAGRNRVVAAAEDDAHVPAGSA